jgi:hypothetical protein
VDVRVGEEAERVRPDLQPMERRECPHCTRAVDLTVSACVTVLAPRSPTLPLPLCREAELKIFSVSFDLLILFGLSKGFF